MAQNCKPGWYASRYANFSVKEAKFQAGVFELKEAGLDDFQATSAAMGRRLGTDIFGPFKNRKEAEKEARFCGRDKDHVIMNESNFSRTEVDQARGPVTELNEVEKKPAPTEKK
jgi:hypothetical protein